MDQLELFAPCIPTVVENGLDVLPISDTIENTDAHVPIRYAVEFGMAARPSNDAFAQDGVEAAVLRRTLVQGSIYEIDGVKHRFRGANGDTASFVSADPEESYYPIPWLVLQLLESQGRFSGPVAPHAGPSNSIAENALLRLPRATPKALLLAEARAATVARVQSEYPKGRYPNEGLMRIQRDVFANERFAELNKSYSHQTVRNWMTAARRNEGSNSIAAQVATTYRSGRKRSIPDWVVEEVQARVWDGLNNGTTLEAVLTDALRDIPQIAAQDQSLIPPKRSPPFSRSWFYKRAEVVRGWYDPQVAETGGRGVRPIPALPLEECEIDPFELPVLLHETWRPGMSADTLPVLGPASVVPIIDRCTGMITGFSVSHLPPCWSTVLAAMKHAMLPKAPWLKTLKLANLDRYYPCHGVPNMLSGDGAAAYFPKAHEFIRLQLGSSFEEKQAYKPWLKGKIERAIRSQRAKLDFVAVPEHAARGRDGSVPVDYALMDAPTLERLLANIIATEINGEANERTQRRPCDHWNELIARNPRPVPAADVFDLAMHEIIERTITAQGISLEALPSYQSVGLQRLRHRLAPTRKTLKVRIAYDPNDMDRIAVEDVGERTWIEVPTTDSAFTRGRSLLELRAEKTEQRRIAGVGKGMKEARLREDREAWLPKTVSVDGDARRRYKTLANAITRPRAVPGRILPAAIDGQPLGFPIDEMGDAVADVGRTDIEFLSVSGPGSIPIQKPNEQEQIFEVIEEESNVASDDEHQRPEEAASFVDDEDDL